MSRMEHEGAPLYDGLFLMDQASVADDFDGAMRKVREVLDRAEAEVLSLRQWEERKLAYPIEGQKRGTFFLSLFRVDGEKITSLERNCELSDEIIRVLITRADHLGQTEIEQEIQQTRLVGDDANPSAADGPEGGSEAQPTEPAEASA